MNLYTLQENWDSVSYDKKIEALEAVVKILKEPYNKDDDLVREMLSGPSLAEDEDYFGTEGLRF